MILHNDPLVSIYFGDARSCFERDFLVEYHNQEDLWKKDVLLSVKNQLHLDSLIMLKQLDGTSGVTVSDKAYSNFMRHKFEGDFLVTQRVLTGLAVYTADCLPVVFYDTYNRAIGICHAGLLGSINKIALNTIERMQKEFGTKLDLLRIFFGPSAKVCCYSVPADFKKNLDTFYYKDKVLIDRSGKFFFDLPLFNKMQLEEYGVKKEAFHVRYNMCTICNGSYCSDRRNGSKGEQQLTIVALK